MIGYGQERNKMKFSLLIPSRERPEMLENLLKGLKKTTKNIDQVEILVKIDVDEPKLFEYQNIINNYGKNIILFICERKPNLSEEYYNFMAKRASGDYIWALNDDIEVISEDFWDEYIENIVEKNQLEGKIAYFNIGVRGHNQVLFSPFPMVSRETVDAFGYLHNPLMVNWDADVVLWNLFNCLRDKYGHDRIYDAQKVFLHHLNWDGSMNDECRKYMEANRPKDGFDAGAFKTYGHYEIESLKLKEAIEQKGV